MTKIEITTTIVQISDLRLQVTVKLNSLDLGDIEWIEYADTFEKALDLAKTMVTYYL